MYWNITAAELSVSTLCWIVTLDVLKFDSLYISIFAVDVE